MTQTFHIGRAGPADADAIAAVHVAGWRSAYPGILPDRVLLGLSARRLAPHYAAAIAHGRHVLVARAGDEIVGYATASPIEARPRLADSEVETLYVLDDWRERGFGRGLLAASAAGMAAAGCRSLYLNVLSDNPSRWFYRRLGAVEAKRSVTRVGGADLAQTAMLWPDIDVLARLAPGPRPGTDPGT